ncbi:unnamed protein product [Rotaria socialis]|uniref:F-box domain-containing protein n=1 Tax=Rotaria socialis TaxID=392032 RepID=A0A818BN91_9BILA|nr:unnamed protein product [Rotaria socialis]CAF3422221.1 unnamed protein product [Rotaria socialis]CAF4288967.1 unnamed protein product [Rotaria socialis]CAF4451428.1 unnamed protein product [Rotaria socialis]
MSNSCLFDFFPVEIIHGIFHYLWAHEIFYGFAQLSDYVDSVLFSYDRYSVSLSSILKHQFDLTCRRIRPEQVISITIAENDETPDQSDLFFSKFNLLQFVNLRSFAIMSSDQSIFRQLNLLCTFNYFQSLSLPQVSQAYWCLCGSSVETMLHRLRQLITNQYPLTTPLNNLRYLTVTHVGCFNLEYLFRQTTNLRSLNMTLSLNAFSDWSNQIPVMNHLRRLTLWISFGRVPMSRMNQFLSKLPCLMHFELRIDDPIDVVGAEQLRKWSQYSNGDVEVPEDIVDGNQWKYLISHLQTFDFRFCLTHRSNEKILDTFRSSFWIEQKQWFVAYDNQESSSCLFTIPRFASKNVIYSPDYCTPSSTSSSLHLDEYVDVLTLPNVCRLTHRFVNARSLILEKDDGLCLETILPFVNLPHLQSLASVKASLMTLFLNYETKFESIRSLRIDAMVMGSHAKAICTVFPRLERLRIGISDQDTIILLIDRLKYLSIAIFTYCHPLSFKSLSRKWLVDKSSRLMANNNFTCSMNTEKLSLWMTIE